MAPGSFGPRPLRHADRAGGAGPTAICGFCRWTPAVARPRTGDAPESPGGQRADQPPKPGA